MSEQKFRVITRTGDEDTRRALYEEGAKMAMRNDKEGNEGKPKHHAAAACP